MISRPDDKARILFSATASEVTPGGGGTMFGRKIPDKVMAPTSSPVGNDVQRTEKKTMSGTPASPRVEISPRRDSGAVETVIGEDTAIVGVKIASKGTLRVDGRVEGEIHAEEAVVVGPNGVVKANIVARSVAISGKVFGNVTAHERLEIQPTGEVRGDIQTAPGALIVEGGAKFEGKCVMGLKDTPSEITPPRPVPVETNPRIEGIQRKPPNG